MSGNWQGVNWRKNVENPSIRGRNCCQLREFRSRCNLRTHKLSQANSKCDFTFSPSYAWRSAEAFGRWIEVISGVSCSSTKSIPDYWYSRRNIKDGLDNLNFQYILILWPNVRFSTLFCTRINNIVTFNHSEAKTNSLKHFNERLLTRQALSMMLANRYKWIPTLELVTDVINRVCRRRYEKHFQQQKCDPKCIAHSSKTLEEQLSLNFYFNHFNSCYSTNMSCQVTFLFVFVRKGFFFMYNLGLLEITQWDPGLVVVLSVDFT